MFLKLRNQRQKNPDLYLKTRLAFVPAVSSASWMVAGFPLLKLFLGKGETVLAINVRYALTVVPGLFYFQ
jgi:hypothetical protein